MAAAQEAAAVHTGYGWCAVTTQLLDRQCRQHSSLQAAVIVIAAHKAAAAHKDYGWSALISQLLICHSLQMLERLKTAGLASLIKVDCMFSYNLDIQQQQTDWSRTTPAQVA